MLGKTPISSRICVGILSAMLLIGPACSTSRTSVSDRQFDSAERSAWVVDQAQYDEAFVAAVAVLRDFGFAIDREDRFFGRISTWPQPADTLWEWVRPTAVDFSLAVSSSLNDQRMVVEVFFSGFEVDTDTAEAGGPRGSDESGETAAGSVALAMHIEVQVFRRQRPAAFFTGATHGGRMVRSPSRNPTELAERGIAGSYWYALGRSSALERRLETDIRRRMEGRQGG